MGVDYYRCTSSGCNEIVNDAGGFVYLEIMDENKNNCNGYYCASCEEEIKNTHIPVFSNQTFLIQLERKRPSVTWMIQNVHAAIIPDIFQIIIDYYASLTFFHLIRHVCQRNIFELRSLLWQSKTAECVMVNEECTDDNQSMQTHWDKIQTTQEEKIDSETFYNEFLDLCNEYGDSQTKWFEAPAYKVKSEKQRLQKEITKLELSLSQKRRKLQDVKEDEDQLFLHWTE